MFPFRLISGLGCRATFRALVVMLVLAAQQLLFVPFTIFAGNADEFSVGFGNLLSNLALPALAVLVIFSALPACLPEKIFEKLLALIIALTIAATIQSSLLVWDYGLLDGRDIDWSAYRSAALIDGILWSLIVFVGVALSRRWQRHTSTVLVFLILYNFLGVVAQLTTFSVPWFSARKEAQEQALFAFSTSRNIIMIVLDAFESPAFQHIIDAEPRYREMFRDFIYFKNTLGAFPTTAPSIPAILTGKLYDNSLPLGEFLRQVLPKQSLPALLLHSGFQTDMVTLPHFCQSLEGGTCLSLSAASQLNYRRAERSELFKLLDLTLFRSSPHFLKRYIYNNQNWLLQQLMEKRIGPLPHVHTINFVDNLVERAEASVTRPVFKFFHLAVPHTPVRLDAECNHSREYRQITIRDYGMQARCALLLAHRIIERLKQLKVYDAAMIVVLADHGFKLNYGYYPKAGNLAAVAPALPLLLVKPPHRNAEMQISEVPGALSDLPLTIANILGLGVERELPGISLFALSEGDVRERIFRNYSWSNDNWKKDFLPVIQEYRINGHAWDPRSWQRGARYEPAIVPQGVPPTAE